MLVIHVTMRGLVSGHVVQRFADDLFQIKTVGILFQKHVRCVDRFGIIPLNEVQPAQFETRDLLRLAEFFNGVQEFFAACFILVFLSPNYFFFFFLPETEFLRLRMLGCVLRESSKSSSDTMVLVVFSAKESGNCKYLSSKKLLLNSISSKGTYEYCNTSNAPVTSFKL